MSTQGQLLSGHCPDPEYVPGLQVQRKKRRAWFKYPNAAYVFTDQKTFKTTPTITFEVGFSEPYQDLLADVNDWIVHTDTVQLVVILYIVEDVKLRNLYQKSNVSSSRVKKLLKAFGNSQAKAAHEMDDRDDDPDSDSEMYSLISDQIITEDWVGPITAHIELWERGSSGPEIRGDRYVSRLLIPWVDASTCISLQHPRTSIMANLVSIEVYFPPARRGNSAPLHQ